MGCSILADGNPYQVKTDLFDKERQQSVDNEAPLAARMRPRTLDEFIGQDHINLTQEEIRTVKELFTRSLLHQTVNWESAIAFVRAELS